MDERIAVLERDVDVIKAELIELRRDYARAEELNARVTRIELDLAVIKGDLGQLRKDVTRLAADLSQLAADLSQLAANLSQLASNVFQLQKDVAQLLKDTVRSESTLAKVAEEQLLIRLEMTRFATEQFRFATREEMGTMKGELLSDIRKVESNLKGWMLGIALTLVTMTSAMFYSLNNTLKAVPGWTAQHMSQQAAPPGKQPPATPR